ncbi:hypothetical protein L3Q82_016267 [Scortum barcoo]|uniref:Uncharacterized protein n=1 Tax=Scortum barcoo TaxID=214431 RepID=A0ACB8VTN0_9TELE|nr:hypothetical protein L3Q82_016267 [Scortum barcoo]
MAAELGSYKQAHTSSPPLTLGNSRVVEGPAPLKELGSRAQAMRGGIGSSRPGPLPRLLPKPHCTGPSWTFLRVVSLLEGGPTSPFRAEPGRVPWAKTQPPGARLEPDPKPQPQAWLQGGGPGLIPPPPVLLPPPLVVPPTTLLASPLLPPPPPPPPLSTPPAYLLTATPPTISTAVPHWRLRLPKPPCALPPAKHHEQASLFSAFYCRRPFLKMTLEVGDETINELFNERRKMTTSPISSVAPPPSAVAPPLGNQGRP